MADPRGVGRVTILTTVTLALATAIAVAVPAWPALAEERDDSAGQDHLKPEDDPFNDVPRVYDEGVARMLFAGSQRATDLQMVSLPSRAPEELVAVRAAGKGYVVEHVKLKESVWYAWRTELEHENSADTTSRRRAEAAAMKAVKIGAVRTTAPIDARLVVNLKAAWGEMLSDRERWRPSHGLFLDGVGFHLAGWTAEARYVWGTTHSPPDGSRCARLVGIAQDLARYADAGAADRPKVAAGIASATDELSRELRQLRRDDQAAE